MLAKTPKTSDTDFASKPAAISEADAAWQHAERQVMPGGQWYSIVRRMSVNAARHSAASIFITIETFTLAKMFRNRFQVGGLRR